MSAPRISSQLRFVMHPDDERNFAAEILSDDNVQLIDGPRWKSGSPETFRSIDDVHGRYCIIWSPQDRASLSARFVPECSDWYCDSEAATIQFLRSELVGSVLIGGRIAINTSQLEDREAAGIERRYKTLARFLKKQYMNSALCWHNPNLPFIPEGAERSPNPSKPNKQVWIGPRARSWLLEHSSHRVKQSIHGVVEGLLCERAAGASAG